MKKYLLAVCILFVIMTSVTTSCNEDKLDLPPLVQTEADFFTTENDFERAVYGVYAKHTDLYWYRAGGWVHDIYHLPGDDITSTGGYAFETFGGITAASGDLGYIYTSLYQLLNRANTVLQKIDTEQGVYTNAEMKNWNKGEMLFLRAYVYFKLWNYFATAPLITTRIQSSAEINAKNSEGTQLLDQAITDFEQAAQLLPLAWPNAGAQLGRVTKNAAYGFLGKTLVFRGTVTDNNADYTAAITAFNAISGRSLTANYSDNFDYRTENNSESLFEHQASQPNVEDNVWLSNDFDNAIGSLSAYWGFYENGTNFAMFGDQVFKATAKLESTYGPQDPRGTYYIDAATNNFMKYGKQDERKLSQTGAGSVNNVRILRLADILLLKAEALLKSNGSKAEAIGLINQVRARARNWGLAAGISDGSAPADRNVGETNTATIMNWIMEERFLELAGEESHRWWDLRRWHLGGDIDISDFDFSSVRTGVSFDVNKHINFPIPTVETDRNRNIIQNPGY